MVFHLYRISRIDKAIITVVIEIRIVDMLGKEGLGVETGRWVKSNEGTSQERSVTFSS